MGQLKKTISLYNVRFYSYHGYFPEEQVLGNEFLVDIEVEIYNNINDSEDLRQTLDYGILFSIAKREMSIPQKLLETVAFRIINSIKCLEADMSSIRVKVKKVALPITSDLGYAAVELTYTF